VITCSLRVYRHAGTVPELVGVDLAAVTLAYYEQTKVNTGVDNAPQSSYIAYEQRLLGAPDVASKEHLQSLVLAAQAESQSGRIDGALAILCLIFFSSQTDQHDSIEDILAKSHDCRCTAWSVDRCYY
jgi:hypothetical protein